MFNYIFKKCSLKWRWWPTWDGAIFLVGTTVVTVTLSDGCHHNGYSGYAWQMFNLGYEPAWCSRHSRGVNVACVAHNEVVAAKLGLPPTPWKCETLLYDIHNDDKWCWRATGETTVQLGMWQVQIFPSFLGHLLSFVLYFLSFWVGKS